MLYLFDIDGTLIESFMNDLTIPYDDVVLMPGRAERLAGLRDDGHQLALVTNQGGVAFGYQTEEQVVLKLCRVLDALDFPADGALRPLCTGWRDDIVLNPSQCYVSLGHPNAKHLAYRTSPEDTWRKPGRGMICRAMDDYGAFPYQTIYVGDMASDATAAAAALVAYAHADEFFATT